MENSRTAVPRIKTILFVLYLLFFAHSFDLYSVKWMVVTLVLYSLPLLAQLSKRTSLRVAGLWLGIFLILQTGVTQYLEKQKSTLQDFRTQEKNRATILDIRGEGIPGVQGIQVVTTDAKGFRVTKPVNYEKKEGIRIFAIGGSTTEQGYLDDHRTWTHLLQDNLEKSLKENIEVVNTGLSGAKARHHLATLKHILPYHPDLAIFLVGINDWNLQIREQFKDSPKTTSGNFFFGKIFFCEKAYLRNTMLGRAIFQLYLNLLKQREIKKYLTVEQRKGRSELIVDDGRFLAAKRNSLSKPIKYHFVPEQVSADYVTSLNEIARICKENNLRCLFMTQPTGYSNLATAEYKKGLWQTPPHCPYTIDFESLIHISTLYNKTLLEFCGTQGIPCFDLASQLEPSYHHFYDDCHYNVEGAKRVSDVLTPVVLKVLREKKL